MVESAFIAFYTCLACISSKVYFEPLFAQRSIGCIMSKKGIGGCI